MTHAIRRSIAALVAALVAGACSGPNAARESAGAPQAPAAATATAGGTLAPTTDAAPGDDINARADKGRIAGDSTATVWVIMASDFQCPYCKQWHDSHFAPLVRDYLTKGKIRMAFINMPLNMHPNAVPAAEAAMCASVQNKFWPMHDALFATQTSWEASENPAAKFDSLAVSVGVNPLQWRQCVSQHQTLPLIEADRDRARQAGVGSTPTFFVGNQTLAGSDKDIPAAIEAALKARQTPKPAS